MYVDLAYNKEKGLSHYPENRDYMWFATAAITNILNGECEMKRKLTGSLLTALMIMTCLFSAVSPVWAEEGPIPEQGQIQDQDQSQIQNQDQDQIQMQDQNQNQDLSPAPVRAKVTQILSHDNNEINYSGGSFVSQVQMIEAEILEGKHKGERIQAENPLNFGMSDTISAVVLETGDRVLLLVDENPDGTVKAAYVSEVVRDTYLLYLVLAFVILLIAIGRFKGLKAVISLTVTCVAIVKILLPMILQGYDPVWVSILVCTGIITITLTLVSGISKKTLAAIIGATGGVLVAGLITLLVGSLASLTGFGDEESMMLVYIPQEVTFNFRGLLFAGIIIGALGAAMDVGISIASAMHEIKSVNPEIKKGELIKAGMNVGKDIMATMSNTLILAYAGGSLQLMLLFMAYDVSFKEIINRDIIASEVVRSMAGSIGLIFTIPITAVVTGMLSERSVSKIRKPRKLKRELIIDEEEAMFEEEQ